MSSLKPENGFIFRITHIANVPWMLDHALHCRNSPEHDPNYVEIGNPELIEKRTHRAEPSDGRGDMCSERKFADAGAHGHPSAASLTVARR